MFGEVEGHPGLLLALLDDVLRRADAMGLPAGHHVVQQARPGGLAKAAPRDPLERDPFRITNNAQVWSITDKSQSLS